MSGEFRRIMVREYSGSKGGERPLVLIFNDESVPVEVVDRWVEEEFETRKRRRFFRLKDHKGMEYLVYLDEDTQDWFMKF